MQNLKIKVNNESESREVQELFFKLGYEMGACSIGFYPAVIITTRAWGAENWCSTRAIGLNHPAHENHKEITLQELRDMVEPKMKEYLFKYNDQYTLVKLSKEDAESNPEQYIEVPEWGNYAYKNDIGVCFFKNAIGYNHPLLIWQRESLNDKIASAEVAREKHNHYKKDVSHLNMIDPYRIADLYDLHPCAEHIMKKSLCAGNRGHKDKLRDIQDIIDTAERWKQMLEEDNHEF